jgi:hypothetical protein
MKDLVKNPLGIVALFISLIYSIANLLLGATASTLTPDERKPLIVFIVLFPVLVLGVFYYLVSRHHGKLYAPGDYKEDKSFLRTLSVEERQQKLDLEIREQVPQEPAPPEHSSLPNTENAEPRGDIAQADVSEKVAPDILYELPRPRAYRIPEPTLYLSREEYRLVESIGVALLEKELGTAERDVAISDSGISFDAVWRHSDGLTFGEVKTLRNPARVSTMLERVLYGAVIAQNILKMKVKLIVIVVYYFEPSELPPVESAWQKKVAQCPAPVDLRFIPRSELAV